MEMDSNLKSQTSLFFICSIMDEIAKNEIVGCSSFENSVDIVSFVV